MSTHNGYDVAQIQRLLNAAGYQPPLAEDGSYGPKTQAAVEWYQQNHGLAVDGDVGPQTWGALNGSSGSTAAAGGASSTLAAQQYPQYAWALNDPELGPILRQAAAEGWDSQRLQGAMYGTNWWKSHSDSVRSSILLEQTDPGTWDQRLKQMQDHVADLSVQLGIQINPALAEGLARSAIQNGWGEDDIRRNLSQVAGSTIDYTSGAVANVKSLADQYLIVLSQDDVNHWTRELAAGRMTQENFAGFLKEQAKILYPALTKQLDEGLTVRQIAQPFAQIAGQVLEIDPNSIDWNDPKWNRMLNQYNDKGEAQMMTRYDAERMLRMDPQYKFDRTSGARQEGAGLSEAFAKMFGAVA